MADVASLASVYNGRHAGNPEECVSRCWSVTFSLFAPVHFGRYRCTGASRSTWCRWTSCIMADVKAMTLVSEAMSHIVLAVGTGDGGQSRCPAPYLAKTRSCVPTMTNAPGNALSATARSSDARIASCIDDSRVKLSGASVNRLTTHNDGSRR